MPTGEGDSTLEDAIADEKSVSPSDSLLQKDLIDQTHKLLTSLSPGEEKILRLRFGIGSDGELILEQIGKQFGLSRERIRRLRRKLSNDYEIPTDRKRSESILSSFGGGSACPVSARGPNPLRISSSVSFHRSLRVGLPRRATIILLF